MGNPRKRKAIKDGRMEQMIAEENQQSTPKTVQKEEKLLFDEPITKEPVEEVENKKTTKLEMDSFIAEELEEIKRISPAKKKPTTKKTTTKKTTTKKATAKKKTGGK
jgi:hypothetical protein